MYSPSPPLCLNMAVFDRWFELWWLYSLCVFVLAVQVRADGLVLGTHSSRQTKIQSPNSKTKRI